MSEKKAVELVKPEAPREALVPIVVPPLSATEILEHFNRIQELKRRLIDYSTRPESDVVLIKGKPYIKKSGWRKLAFAFNLSDEIVREEKEERPDGEVIHRIWTKVTAPNGRYVVAVGCATSREKDYAHEAHDPYALAATRSKNRAISDIIGLGELSAEELLPTEEAEKPEPAKVEPEKFKPPEPKWLNVVWQVDNLMNQPLEKKDKKGNLSAGYRFLMDKVKDLQLLGAMFQIEEDEDYLYKIRCAEIPESEKNRFLGTVAYNIRQIYGISDAERQRVKVEFTAQS